ncbi:MAG TPA: LuxR C-terminal-related transcriptional regulator [Glycomyces sp.]|nr:LuxR C-terminal-related transcriptional regulator [Glycomyces sp.]
MRALAVGGAAFSPRVGRWLLRRQTGERENRSTKARATVAALTPRQRDLLAEVGKGQSNAQVAKALRLSEGTVKQYLSALFTALGIDNRVQAAIIACEAGLDTDR